MEKIFKLKSFWAVSLLAILGAFLLMINRSGIYRSTFQILIIPQSEAAIENSNQIIENLRQIPYTLSFYNRIIIADSDFENETVKELPNNKRLDYWNSKLNVERIGTSGILRLSIAESDRFLAESLAFQIRKTFVETIGIYYDIEKDLGIRIIDQEITRYAHTPFEYKNFLLISAGCLVMVFVVFYLVSLIFDKLEGKNNKPKFSFEYKKPDFSGWYLKKDVHDEKSEVQEDEESKKEVEASQDNWPINLKEEQPYTDFINKGKTAAAPDNLPIADPSEIFKLQAEPENKEEVKKDEVKKEQRPTEEKKPLTHEATEEQVKERLNKLLSGKL